MKRFAYLPCILTLLLSCVSDTKKQDVNKTPDVYTILTKHASEIRTYNTKDSIPDAFSVLIPDLASMADFNEPFQATDVVIADYPTKKIAFVGTYGNFWIVTSKRGGLGMSWQFYYGNLNKGFVHNFQCGSGYRLDDVVQIAEAIKSLKLKFGDCLN